MAIFQDIATALTESVPTDGSAAFTGPINFNNQTISGASNISATGTVSGNTVSGNTGVFTNLTVTNATNLNYLVNNLNANNQNISNVNVLTGSSANITTLGCSGLNVGSVAYIPVLGQSLNANNQNITGINTVQAGNASFGSGTFNGSVNFNAQTNFNALMNANGNYLVNVSEITGWNGALITNSTFYFYNSIAMQGSNIYNVGYITYAGRAAPADALQAVRSMAAQRSGERNLIEAVDTLIAAVAELSHAPA